MIGLLFTIIWWFGFLLSVGLMLGLYAGVGFIEKYVGVIFLVIGIQHMLILVVLAFFAIIKEREDNIEMGNRVATMGYLHTLIGTSVALIMTSKFGGMEMIEHIDSIIAPIGSALITSIIGWAFGKEMERERYRYKLSSSEESEKSLEFLAQKVVRSANLIEASSQKWVETIDRSSEQLALSTKSLDETISSANRLSTESIETLSQSFKELYLKMQKNLDLMTQTLESDLTNSSKATQKIIAQANDSFKEQFERIEREVAMVERGFDSSSKEANRVFKNSIETFDNGLSKMNLLAKEWDRNLKTMKKFSTHSESALESLTEHSQKVVNEFVSVAKSLPSAGKILNEVDEFLAKIKKEK